MLDTVNLYLERISAGKIDLLAEIPCHLIGISERQKDGRTTISGYLNNYRITVSESGVSFSGSLPKYYLNDNFQTLSRGDSERAFEKLSDELHLPVLRSKIYRVDLAQNFIMNYEPEIYYPYLGESNHYNRLIQPHSLYFTNSFRTKLFYNKIKEGKKAGIPLPDVWESENVLRYELRFQKRIPQQMRTSKFTPSELISEDTYIKLIDRWVEEYDSIQKIQKMTMKFNEIKEPKPKVSVLPTHLS